MRSRRRLLLLLPLLAGLLAAAPRADVPAEELIRAGNAAVARGEFETADEWYTAAEEVSADPGLVAFNKATTLFHRERFADAERHYTRALDDADAPPARRAAALYNRGVCLLKQGGLQKLRTAIDSFDRCLALKPDDSTLTADARHNLELAKLLWAEARAKDASKPLNNDPPPDAPPEPRPPLPRKDFNPFQEDPTTTAGGNEPAGRPHPVKGTPQGTPQGTDQKTAGKGHAPVIGKADQLPPDWDEQMVRTYLEALAVRVAKERSATAALTAPPERPSVKDW